MSSTPDASIRQPSGRMARLMLMVFWPAAIFPAVLIGGLVYLVGFGTATVSTGSATIPPLSVAVVGLASLVILGLSGALIHLAAVRITAPLVNLVNIMNAYLEGHRDWRAPLERSGDESGDLARLFNELANENQELNRSAIAGDALPALKANAWLQLSQAVSAANDQAGLAESLLKSLKLVAPYTKAALYLVEAQPLQAERPEAQAQQPLPQAVLNMAISGNQANGQPVLFTANDPVQNRFDLDPVAHPQNSLPWLISQAAVSRQPLVMRPALPGETGADAGSHLHAAIPLVFAGQAVGVIRLDASNRTGAAGLSTAAVLSTANGVPTGTDKLNGPSTASEMERANGAGAAATASGANFTARTLADLQAIANLLAPAFACWQQNRLAAPIGAGLPAAASNAESGGDETVTSSAALTDLPAEVPPETPQAVELAPGERETAELRLLWNVSQAVASHTEPLSLYETIHAQVEGLMGAISSFAIALYARETDTIAIPYMVEEGQPLEIPDFPLGEGLTSIVIRRRQPLLLAENVAEQIQNLGAKTIGEAARSWLGVPLMLADEPIGAIIVQDVKNEGRFTIEDQRLLVTLASQLAIFIRNTQLLEATRLQARQEHLINAITAQISSSIDMQEILTITASQLGAALGAQRAHARLIRPQAQRQQAKQPQSQAFASPARSSGGGRSSAAARFTPSAATAEPDSPGDQR